MSEHANVLRDVSRFAVTTETAYGPVGRSIPPGVAHRAVAQSTPALRRGPSNAPRPGRLAACRATNAVAHTVRHIEPALSRLVRARQ